MDEYYASNPLDDILLLNKRYQEIKPDDSNLDMHVSGYLEYLFQLDYAELSQYNRLVGNKNTSLPEFGSYEALVTFYVGLGNIEGLLNVKEGFGELEKQNYSDDILRRVTHNASNLLYSFILESKDILKQDKISKLLNSHQEIQEIERSYLNKAVRD
jgi:hypothetical protein